MPAVAAALGWLALAAAAEPLRPADDALVLANVPAGTMSRRLSGSAPADLGEAIRLARAAIEQGRSLSDPRSYGQAEALLAPWWTEPDPPQEVRVLRAVILQSAHRFAAARADLDAVIAASPGNPQARFSRAMIAAVTGDVDAMRADCQALPRRAGRLALAICLAHADGLTGQAQRGYDRLAAAVATEAGRNPALAGFAERLLAELAMRLGRSADADRHFARAADGATPDIPLLVTLADHLLATGRAAEVLTRLDGRGDADALLLRLAIAGQRTGDPRTAQWAAILRERFAAAAAAGNRVHLREEARFRLDVEGDAAGAVTLAADNWKTQKEPADAELLLACAIAAGDPQAAAPVILHLAATGFADPRIDALVRVVEGELR